MYRILRDPTLKDSRYSRYALVAVSIGVHSSVHNTADPCSLLQTPFVGVAVFQAALTPPLLLALPAVPAVDVSIHGPRVAEAVPLHAEDFLEGIPELRTPAVNERIEGGVRVTYPVEYPEGEVDVLYLPDGHHHVEQKEGQPAQSEDPHDDAQCL